MNGFLLPSVERFYGQLLIWFFANEGLARGLCFILVASRLTGFLCAGAFVGQSLLTWRIRLGMVVLLTLIVAPSLPLPEVSIDVKRDSTLSPVSLSEQQSTNSVDWLPAGGLHDASRHSPLRLLVLASGELALGGILGLGVAVVLAGLQFGAEWLDRHSGLGIGSVINPEFLSGGGCGSGMSLLFGMTALLLMEPLGGHLLVLQTVLETFRSLPVGNVEVTRSMIELPLQLMHHSLLLGLRVALPMVIAMSVIDMTFGFINRSSSGTLAPMTFVIRTLAGLLLLAVTLPGIADAVQRTVLDAVEVSQKIFERTGSA